MGRKNREKTTNQQKHTSKKLNSSQFVRFLFLSHSKSTVVNLNRTVCSKKEVLYMQTSYTRETGNTVLKTETVKIILQVNIKIIMH